MANTWKKQNGYTETASCPPLWALLFGPLYFLFKGIWIHAVLSLVLAIMTIGVSHFIYWIFAGKIVENHYRKNGWERYNGTDDSKTPSSPRRLLNAASLGLTQNVSALLSEGVSPNAADENGKTALMLAAYGGHAEVVKVLLAAKVNPNVATNKGGTALIAAATRGHAEIAKTLLSAGANPNSANEKGKTALDIAKEIGHSEVVGILKDKLSSPISVSKLIKCPDCEKEISRLAKACPECGHPFE